MLLKYVIIVLGIAGVSFCVHALVSNRVDKDTKVLAVFGYTVLSLFLIAIVNLASFTVHTITGTDKESHESHKYFLVYGRKDSSNQGKWYFIPPFSKKCIIENNTDSDLKCCLLLYSSSKGNANYRTYLLNANSASKFFMEPNYFFENVPSGLRLRSGDNGLRCAIIKLEDDIVIEDNGIKTTYEKVLEYSNKESAKQAEDVLENMTPEQKKELFGY